MEMRKKKIARGFLAVDGAVAAFCCLQNGGWALGSVLGIVALPPPLPLRAAVYLSCISEGMQPRLPLWL